MSTTKDRDDTKWDSGTQKKRLIQNTGVNTASMTRLPVKR